MIKSIIVFGLLAITLCVTSCMPNSVKPEGDLVTVALISVSENNGEAMAKIGFSGNSTKEEPIIVKAELGAEYKLSGNVGTKQIQIQRSLYDQIIKNPNLYNIKITNDSFQIESFRNVESNNKNDTSLKNVHEIEKNQNLSTSPGNGNNSLNKLEKKESKPLYGFTRNGIFFIHKVLVAEVKGTKPKFRSGGTLWKDVQMKETSEYFYYKFPDERNFSSKMLYCFKVEGNFFIPQASIDCGSKKIITEDVKDNNQGGSNFFTEPIESAPFEL